MTRLRTLVVAGSVLAPALLLPGTPAQAAPGSPPTSSGTITFPLPAALAVVGALLLAVVMVVVLQRRRVAAGLAVLAGLVTRLGEPARRRRRVDERRRLAQGFVSDGETVRRAYDVFADAAGAAHAIRLAPTGPEIWVSPADPVDQPWTRVDETRWQRPSTGRATATGRHRGPDGPIDGCLVRVGGDATGIPTFVDLTRLDGVLSIVGDATVARDALRNLLGEMARLRPGLPLVVLRTAGDVPIALPAGLRLRPEPPVPPHRAGPLTPVRATVRRRPVRGLVIATGNPDPSQQKALLAWCGHQGGGWTGVVCGDAGDGAHWRWEVDGEGTLGIPALGLDVTVPA